MYKAITVKSIEFNAMGRLLVIQEDTEIQVKELADNTLVGILEGVTFEIDPDEFVKLLGKQSELTH